MTGVEEHAQAILDRHVWVNDGSHLICAICWGDQPWPCPDHDAAEAVLVAAREHDTRQAKAIQHLEAIVQTHSEIIAEGGEHTEECSTCESWEWPCETREAADAALRLLRGGEA